MLFLCCELVLQQSIIIAYLQQAPLASHNHLIIIKKKYASGTEILFLNLKVFLAYKPRCLLHFVRCQVFKILLRN